MANITPTQAAKGTQRVLNFEVVLESRLQQVEKALLESRFKDDDEVYLRECLEENIKLPPETKARVLKALSHIYLLKSEYEAAKSTLLALEDCLPQGSAKALLPLVRLRLGIILLRQAKYKDAESNFLDAYQMASEFGDSVISLSALQNLGALARNIGDYTHAIEVLEECLNKVVLPDNSLLASRAHTTLSQLYLEIRNLNLSSAHLSEAERLHDHSLEEKVVLSLLRAALAIESGNLDDAKSIVNSLEQANRTFTEPSYSVSLLNLKGKLAYRHGRTHEAFSLYQQSFTIASSLQSERLAVNCLQLLVESALTLGLWDWALATASEVEQRYSPTGYTRMILLEQQGLIYEAMGNYKTSLDCFKRFHEFERKLSEQASSRRSLWFGAKLEVQRREREAAHFRERSVFYAKELSQRTSYLVQQNEFVNEVIEYIQKIAVQRPEAIDLLKDIRKRLRNLPAASFDWSEYLRLFDEIHPNALAILEEKFPELSKTESKICSLVLANLSSPEISRLLSVSERTVQNHRYRLRKKMGISADTDLAAFIDRLIKETSFQNE